MNRALVGVWLSCLLLIPGLAMADIERLCSLDLVQDSQDTLVVLLNDGNKLVVKDSTPAGKYWLKDGRQLVISSNLGYPRQYMVCTVTGVDLSRLPCTYPGWYVDQPADESLVSIYPDTTQLSEAELALIDHEYLSIADIVGIAEISGIRHVGRGTNHPISYNWIGGETLTDVVFIKPPRMTKLGRQIYGYLVGYKPIDEHLLPWLTIHSLGKPADGLVPKKVVICAFLNGPLPEFWGFYIVLPDSLQK